MCVCVCLGTTHSHPHSPVCSCSPDAEMSCVSNCRLSWCENLAGRLGLTSQMVCNCLINSLFVRFYAFHYYLFCHLQFTMQIPPSLIGKTLHSVHMSTNTDAVYTYSQFFCPSYVDVCVYRMWLILASFTEDCIHCANVWLKLLKCCQQYSNNSDTVQK